ncbi:hypothetical protein [Paracoccus sp. TOH]|uniref:hypothetical protein n=1 Tax=Paracoccus sp. TOH TaxID=1263728 RepID=UPI0025B0C01A|nr:hypothetical protein [Paracoccus sp. TOH]WJS87221.1 hypothetical protein NBE95_20290 [Paracoccus sp. TOH]
MLKLTARHIAFAALLGVLSQPAFAQVNAPEKTTLDLDGKLPPEQLQEWEGGKRVLFWSVPDGAWIEIFRAGNVTGLVEDNRSFFKRIVADGRQWQWRNEGFVPLVAEVAVAAGPTNDDDFDAAVSIFEADLAEKPSNGAGNMTFLHRTEKGEIVKAVQLATTTICAAGGSECPLVVLRPGRDPQAYFFSLDSAWGFFEAGGKLQLEYQRPKAVVQVDMATGNETELEMIEPKAAQSPPNHPRHVE